MGKWIVVLLLLLTSPIVLADGKVFKGFDVSSFVPVPEESQHAVIVHDRGREGMLLAVNFNLEGNEKAFWLFPVPGRPEEVKADVIDTFPQINGIQPAAFAKMKFQLLFDCQMLSQLYTWPFMCFMSSLGKAGMDINIHSVVEKDGLRIETLTAGTLLSLNEHLKDKGIDIADSELAVFSDYLNDQYSLIFVEIASRDELLKQFPDYPSFQRGEDGRWPCVFVEFPSEEIFFPLKPTGSYQEPIRIFVKVLKYVKSKQELDDSWHLGYYHLIDAEEALPDVLIPYVTEQPPCYTLFRFYGDASQLTDDLWMIPHVPNRVRYAQFINSFAGFGRGSVIIITWLAFFLFQSWACAGLAGFLCYRKWNPYAGLGLGNIATLFGVYLLAKYCKRFPETNYRDDEQSMKSFRLYRYRESEISRTHFLFLFSLLFMISSILFYVISTFPL